MNFTFGKVNRLKSKNQIAGLFKHSSSGFVYPVKFLFRIQKNRKIGTTQLMITVPKRNVKLAVKRNKIKRLLRETYRLQRPTFEKNLLENQVSVDIALIFLGKEIPPYDKLYATMKNVLYSIANKTA